MPSTYERTNGAVVAMSQLGCTYPPIMRRLSKYWYQSFGTRRKPSGQASTCKFKVRQAPFIHTSLAEQDIIFVTCSIKMY